MSTKPLGWCLEITYQGEMPARTSRFKDPVLPRPQTTYHDFKFEGDLHVYMDKHVPFLKHPVRHANPEDAPRFTYRIFRR